MSAATPALEAPPRFEPALMRRKLTGTLFYGACLLAISLLVTLLVLLYEVLRQGRHVARPGLRHGCAKPRPARSGILPALVGSLELVIVGFLAFPVGIAAAIYLEEYATDSGSSPAPDEHRGISPACRQSSTASSVWACSSG